MSQFIGFGSGSDGDATLSGTETPIDSSAATSGANLTATNASFVANQLVLIHQTQGSSVGGWEVNQIKTYVAGTITPSIPLANTYSTSAGNHHQVRVIPQYRNVTVSGTFTCKGWTGTVGGLLMIFANGKVTVTGTITATSAGFAGGIQDTTTRVSGSTGVQGEGTAGIGAHGTSANGNGGGGGYESTANSLSGYGAAGGSNATTGGLGSNNQGFGGGPYNSAGSLVGQADCIIMNLGGGGGSGVSDNSAFGPTGAPGGGIVAIFANQFDASSGIVTSHGGSTTNRGTGNQASDAGGGAGGIVLIKCGTGTFGTQIAALGSAGSNATVGPAGNGGNGYIRLECCTQTDPGTYSTNPSASLVTGGFSWCGLYSTMM